MSAGRGGGGGANERPRSDHVIWGPMRGLGKKLHGEWTKKPDTPNGHCNYMKESAQGPILWKFKQELSWNLHDYWKTWGHANKWFEKSVRINFTLTAWLTGPWAFYWIRPYAGSSKWTFFCFVMKVFMVVVIKIKCWSFWKIHHSNPPDPVLPAGNGHASPGGPNDVEGNVRCPATWPSQPPSFGPPGPACPLPAGRTGSGSGSGGLEWSIFQNDQHLIFITTTMNTFMT